MLANEKITAYYTYRKAHAALFDSESLEELNSHAKTTLLAYIDNREIHAELGYYNQHKQILGKHAIFKHAQKLKDLQNFSIVELIKLRENLEHNIWRITNEINKNQKPHLKGDRLRRLRLKRTELIQVNRLIESHE